MEKLSANRRKGNLEKNREKDKTILIFIIVDDLPLGPLTVAGGR